jgi:cytochrome P450
LAFLAATVKNPISAWSQLLYEKPIIVDTLFGQPFAYLCDPEDIRRVLVTDADDFPKAPVNRRVLAPALGDGIFTAEGAAWRWQRRAVAPIFRAGELDIYIPAMVRATDAMIKAWRSQGLDGVRCVDEAMTATTLAIILDTMVSDAEVFEPGELRQTIGSYLAPTSWLVMYDLAGLPEWMPYPGRARLQRAGRTLRDGVASIIARRRRSSERKSTHDLLDRLMAAKDPETGREMSDENLIDSILTFLLAGHETSAVALTWTLSLLAQAPWWQDRVREEVHSLIGDSPIEAGHLDKLTLTEQVLKEAMRLFPPASVLARIATKDCEIGGRAVPAGTRVTIPIYAVHRHTRLWDNPNAFDPCRFSPQREAERSRFAYLPFGVGPRVCVGASFAMMEMKVVLATLLRNVRIEPSPDPPPLPVLRVTLRPYPRLNLRMKFET